MTTETIYLDGNEVWRGEYIPPSVRKQFQKACDEGHAVKIRREDVYWLKAKQPAEAVPDPYWFPEQPEEPDADAVYDSKVEDEL